MGRLCGLTDGYMTGSYSMNCGSTEIQVILLTLITWGNKCIGEHVTNSHFSYSSFTTDKFKATCKGHDREYLLACCVSDNKKKAVGGVGAFLS